MNQLIGALILRALGIQLPDQARLDELDSYQDAISIANREAA